MYANILASVVHFFLATYLAITCDMGILGVSISSSFQFFIRYCVTLSYIKFCGKFDDKELQVGLLHSDSLKNWKGQFVLSLHAMSLSVWSWWAMDVFTLIASYMTEKELSTQTIMRNITLLTFMIPCGIQIAAGILVGNNIGANKIILGKAYA
jgi:Na+-driven multidrug efflux pump